MELTRKNEALIRTLHTRHGRKKSGLCICEGVRAVDELMLRRPELVRFSVATAEALAALQERRTVSGEVCIVPEAKLNELAGTVTPQGILTVAEVPAEPSVTEKPADPFILALDRLGDPGNFGTIVRSVCAVGLTELWYTKGSIDPYGDKAIRSALGAQFALKLRSFPDLAALRDCAVSLGYDRFCVTDPHDGENCFTAENLYERSVIVIGGEANGATMLPNCRHVMIPMPGDYESLNAAQAATIFLFDYVRLNFRA
ncbi:MAG: RNA methyltransferase [Lentisphaeria bacterium]|nr:RNA methyltransferase [Lentisphaeria bacterium]